MSAELPDLDLATFADRLRAATAVPVPEATARALHAHYQELRRWNRALSLLGPAAVGDVVERHYAEALEGVPLLPDAAETLVDVGSGAGFPGFVLAAARPDLAVVLVEPRERRWAFLQAAGRRSGLPCRCLNARVERPLPQDLPDRIDVVTLRALKLPREALAALATRFSAASRVLIWAGASDPELPPGLAPGRSRALPGARHRRILELRPVAAGD